jgi:hypothetical protein
MMNSTHVLKIYSVSISVLGTLIFFVSPYSDMEYAENGQ